MSLTANRPSSSKIWRRSVTRALVVWLLAVEVPAVWCQVSAPLGAASPSAQAADPRQLLKQLDNVSVDPTQIYALRHAEIVRDQVKIYFNRGFVGFFTKVDGEITGATFSGDGEILVIPPSPVEKRNLAQFTQSPILEEQFTSAYLRFTDQTARELATRATRPDPEDIDQPTGFVDEWAPLIRRLNSGQSLRVLQNLLGERDRPFFHARLRGAHLGWFEVSDDERLLEAVKLGSVQTRGDKLFADLWCSFPSQTSEARFDALMDGPAIARSYTIDTRINADNSLDGRAALEFESRSSRDRVLFFELSHHLKVSAVKEAGEGQGRNLIFFQSPPGEESEAAARGNDWVVVVLPASHAAGEKFRLDFVYHGDVIADVGNGVLYVGAHGIWYPNANPMRSASYDLTFHYPDHLTLVATGKRVEETAAEGWKNSRWVSESTLPVAGFNLGAYAAQERRAGNTTIEAYAAAGAEASLEKQRLRAESSEKHATSGHDGGRGPADSAAVAAPLDPAALLDDVSDRATRAVRYFESLFGPFPYPRLALAQIPGNFGQGWPELVYLPTLSFLPSSTRAAIAGETADDLANQLFVPHEIAHQWWGNEVGWKTYHDQWISEGSASYAAALDLALDQDGAQKFRDLMGDYRRALLSKNPNGQTVESGGPIWLGGRLSNSLNPGGYDAIVYKKACWVLHMLRTLIIDPEGGSAATGRSSSSDRQPLGPGIARPDERFFKMLREFVATYRGRDPTTDDFIRLAEKYMSADADLDHNHRLEWFFTDWVFGTGIPTYQLHVATRRLAVHKFVVEGSIEQSDVSQDFEMLVPLVATYGKDHVVPLGRVVVNESGGRFKFTTSAKPSLVAINEDDILAVVR